MYILLHLVAAGARRRRGGGLVAAALAQAPVTVRILGAHAGDQLPVDDRIHAQNRDDVVVSVPPSPS